jgi:ribosome biogenesis ATPase
MIDPAMCRPGRLDKLLYVDLPDAAERAEILRTMLRSVPLAGEIITEDGSTIMTLYGVLDLVRKRCEGYSGADLAAIVREAGVLALRETLATLDAAQSSFPYSSNTAKAATSHIQVTLAHFESALDKVMPSVSTVQRRKYEALRTKFAGLPVRGGGDRGVPGAASDRPDSLAA